MKHAIHRGLGALLLAGASAVSIAQTPPAPAAAPTPAVYPEHHHMRAHPFMRILRQLDLTADQKSKIHAIYETGRTNMESLEKSTRSNLERLMSTPPGDTAYATLTETAKSNALAHIKLITDIQAQIYAALTPEQQAKIPGIVAAEEAKRDAAGQKWRDAHEAPRHN
jgi:Spy/CpxP family protein refolding chaperone